MGDRAVRAVKWEIVNLDDSRSELPRAESLTNFTVPNDHFIDSGSLVGVLLYHIVYEWPKKFKPNHGNMTIISLDRTVNQRPIIREVGILTTRKCLLMKAPR